MVNRLVSILIVALFLMAMPSATWGQSAVTSRSTSNSNQAGKPAKSYDETEPPGGVPVRKLRKESAPVVQIVQPKPDQEKEEIFTAVEMSPEFPGGEAAMLAYLARNVHYPAMAQEQGIQGKCIVKFVVTKIGRVGEVQVVRSLSPDCDREAIRVCKSLPAFTPGRQNGQACSVWYTLPVTFKLQN